MTTFTLGLSGYAQSGKTTAASFIEGRFGFERRHIAEPLRAMLAVLLVANGLSDGLIKRYLTGDLKESVIPEIGRTSRELQITLGTEWGRERVHADLWADTWARSLTPGSRVLNDSVRFPNEARAVMLSILIRRKGTHPVAYKWGRFGRLLYHRFGCMWGVHDSERTDRLTPDYVIDNDGSLEDLHAALVRILEPLSASHGWKLGNLFLPTSTNPRETFFL